MKLDLVSIIMFAAFFLAMGWFFIISFRDGRRVDKEIEETKRKLLESESN